MSRGIIMLFIVGFIMVGCANTDFTLSNSPFGINGSNVTYNNCSVGINTTNPQDCLHVQGNVRANTYKIQNSTIIRLVSE